MFEFTGKAKTLAYVFILVGIIAWVAGYMMNGADHTHEADGTHTEMVAPTDAHGHEASADAHAQEATADAHGHDAHGAGRNHACAAGLGLLHQHEAPTACDRL